MGSASSHKAGELGCSAALGSGNPWAGLREKGSTQPGRHADPCLQEPQQESPPSPRFPHRHQGLFAQPRCGQRAAREQLQVSPCSGGRCNPRYFLTLAFRVTQGGSCEALCDRVGLTGNSLPVKLAFVTMSPKVTVSPKCSLRAHTQSSGQKQASRLHLGTAFKSLCLQ